MLHLLHFKIVLPSDPCFFRVKNDEVKKETLCLSLWPQHPILWREQTKHWNCNEIYLQWQPKDVWATRTPHCFGTSWKLSFATTRFFGPCKILQFELWIDRTATWGKMLPTSSQCDSFHPRIMDCFKTVYCLRMGPHNKCQNPGRLLCTVLRRGTAIAAVSNEFQATLQCTYRWPLEIKDKTLHLARGCSKTV